MKYYLNSNYVFLRRENSIPNLLGIMPYPQALAFSSQPSCQIRGYAQSTLNSECPPARVEG